MRNILVIALVMSLASCGAAQECKDPANMNSLKCTAINVAIDCTKDIAPAVLTQVGTVFEQVVLENTSADGTVDWGHVWQIFGRMGQSYGACLIGNMIDSYAASPPKIAPGEVRPSVDELKKGLVAAKATYHLAPTDKIKTARSVHQ